LFVEFPSSEHAAWIRLVGSADIDHATAAFSYRNKDSRSTMGSSAFDGVAKPGDTFSGGLVRACGDNKRTLSFSAVDPDGTPGGHYEMAADLKLLRVDGDGDSARKSCAIPVGVLKSDAASVIFTDDKGKRWRLPKGDPAFESYPFKDYRVDREVATERDRFNAQGTFYELPAENAGGFIKVRPVATHNRLIHDYCSYRSLFVLTGVVTPLNSNNPHIIRSADGKVALWAGAVDDIWQLGKPRGIGGPWKDSPVEANQPSDPYLMTAYDSKSLTHDADKEIAVTVELDVTGDGDWVVYQTFDVKPGVQTTHAFPESFSAYWIRFKSNAACKASAILEYR
jgi:hypothetical protein